MILVDDNKKMTDLLKNRGINHKPSLSHLWNRDKEFYLDLHRVQCIKMSENQHESFWKNEWVFEGNHLRNIYTDTWILL